MSPSPHHDQASSSHHVQPPTPAKPCWLLTLPVFNISAHAGPELTIIAATTKATVANQSMRLMLAPPPSVAGNPLNKRVAPYSSKDAYGTPFGAAYWRNHLFSRGGRLFCCLLFTQLPVSRILGNYRKLRRHKSRAEAIAPRPSRPSALEAGPRQPWLRFATTYQSY